MSKPAFLIVLACTVLAASTMAESPDQPAVAAPDLQRHQINVLRKEKLTELAAQDTACLSRFSVTDCQNNVGVRRRQMLSDLRRQEARLDEVDRRQKGADQLQRSQDKAADAAQRASEVSATIDRNTQKERQKALDEKVLSHKKQAKTDSPPVPAIKAASGLDAQTIEKNRQAYSEKQLAAERRRQGREKRLLDSVNGSAPLPKTP
jgi:colicin import membrane protein